MRRGVALDLAGQRFGRLAVVGLAQKQDSRHRFWDCRCDCGGTATVRADKLTPRQVVFSCGCLLASKNKTPGAMKPKPPKPAKPPGAVPTGFDNAAARRFLSAPPPRGEGLTLAALANKHCPREPAFAPYRVRVAGEWG